MVQRDKDKQVTKLHFLLNLYIFMLVFRFSKLTLLEIGSIFRITYASRKEYSDLAMQGPEGRVSSKIFMKLKCKRLQIFCGILTLYFCTREL